MYHYICLITSAIDILVHYVRSSFYYNNCLHIVQQYPHKEELLRNMMGLLGNVAEVEYLRIHLMQERYVTVFANLLRSNSDGIEVLHAFLFFSLTHYELSA